MGPQNLVFYEAAQFFTAAGVAQFTQGLGFNLPDALTGDRKILPDFFQSVLGIETDPKPFSEDFFLAAGQRAQHFQGLVFQVLFDDGVDRRQHFFVFDESSSPIGVSREMGSLAILRTLRTLSTGRLILSAISSGVGSRPSSCTRWRHAPNEFYG